MINVKNLAVNFGVSIYYLKKGQLRRNFQLLLKHLLNFYYKPMWCYYGKLLTL